MSNMTLILLVLFYGCMAPLQVYGQGGSVLEYELLEQSPAGTEVARLMEGAGLETKYKPQDLSRIYLEIIEGEEETTWFTISDKGILTTAEIIDRDEICISQDICKIEIRIAVKPIQFFQLIKVVIKLLDLNDNAPRFPEPEVELPISESAQIGVMFPLLPAEDPDSPENGIHRYALIADTNSFELKVALNQGQNMELSLVLTEPLDHERVTEYKLQLVAYDSGEPAKSGAVEINVKVMDENDNTPIFTREEYSAIYKESMEAGTVLTKVHAEDLDSGKNGEVHYGLTDKSQNAYGDRFRVDSLTGEVILLKALTFEEQSMYELGVTAQDLGQDSLPVLTKVIIRVEDFNSHAPNIIINFNSDLGDDKIVVMENNKVPIFVTHITVQDNDVGENGKFNCTLRGEQFRLSRLYETEFKIEAHTRFDREKISQYDIELRCTDLGTPPKTSEKILVVNIGDENDHPPIFTNSVYSTRVEENSRVGTFVLAVSATDQDIGKNGEVEFTLSVEGHSEFSINSKSGVITTKNKLDRELLDYYRFPVLATDLGDPKKSATAEIEIHVLDVDDQTPEFTRKYYHFNFTENNQIEDVVGHVSAYDNDLPPNNQYYFTIDSQTLVNAFVINRDTGEITANKVIDRETQENHTLIIHVHSLQYPNHANVATVYIKVLDQNDNAPTFEFPGLMSNSVYITSFMKKGSTIFKVRAYDPDKGKNATIKYMISEGNEYHEFEINANTGLLVSNLDLQGKTEALYRLVLMAKDGGDKQKLSVAILFVHVNITDTEDNSSMLTNSKGVTLSNMHILIIVCVCAGGGILILLLVLGILIIRRQMGKTNHGYNTGKKNNVTRLQPHDTLSRKEENIDGIIESNTGMVGERRCGSEGSNSSDMEGHLEETIDPPTPFNERDSDSGCCCADTSFLEAVDRQLVTHQQLEPPNQKISAPTPPPLHVKCYHSSGPHRPVPRNSTIAEWVMGDGRYPRLNQIPEDQNNELHNDVPNRDLHHENSDIQHGDLQSKPHESPPKSCIKRPSKKYFRLNKEAIESNNSKPQGRPIPPPRPQPRTLTDSRDRRYTSLDDSAPAKTVRFSDNVLEGDRIPIVLDSPESPNEPIRGFHNEPIRGFHNTGPLPDLNRQISNFPDTIPVHPAPQSREGSIV